MADGPCCAIPHCEWCDTTENKGDARLLPVCQSGGHFLHLGCLKQLFIKTRTPSCPLCRDDWLAVVAGLARDNDYTPSPEPEQGPVFALQDVLWEEPQDGTLTGNVFGDGLFGVLLANVIHNNNDNNNTPRAPPRIPHFSPFYPTTAPRPNHEPASTPTRRTSRPRRHGSNRRPQTRARRAVR